MKNQPSFFQSLKMNSLQLLDDIIVWDIDHVQKELIIKRLGNNYEKQKNPLLKDEIYIWLEENITLFYSPFETGLVFGSNEEAEIIIPMLRQHEFINGQIFWFLSLDWKKTNQLLLNPKWQSYPCEEFDVFLNKNTGSFISRIGEGSGFWFQNKEHFQYHLKQTQALEAML